MIELGEIRPVETWSPVRRPRHRRWWRLLVLVAVALALTGPSTLARPDYLGDPTTVPVGGAVSVLIDGDHAYVADDTNGRDRLQAYDLRTGHHRWTRGVDFFSGRVNMSVTGGVLLVSSVDRSGAGTVAYDPDSGATRWTATPPLAGITDTGRPILVDMDPAGAGASITVLDPGTGTPIWSRPLGDCGFTFGSPLSPNDYVIRNVTSLLRVCRAGDAAPVFELSVTDLRTGRVTATTAVPAPGPERWADVTVVGGVVLVKDISQPNRPSIALRLSDLSQAWVGPDTDPSRFINRCGDRICFSDDQGTSVLDPATGRPTGPADAVAEPQATGYFLVTSLIDYAGDGIQSADGTFPTRVAAPGPTWLAVGSDAGYRVVQPLPDVGPGACLISGGALVCAEGDNVNVMTNRLVIWRLPR